MVNGIRTLYSHGLNKAFGSKSCVDSRLQQEIFEEGWRTHQRCEYKDENNCPNILNDKKIYVDNHIIFCKELCLFL